MDVFTLLNEVFGSQAELARRLGVSPMTISQWKVRGRIPAERCAAISALSQGEISLADLRPDLFALAPPDSTSAAA